MRNLSIEVILSYDTGTTTEYCFKCRSKISNLRGWVSPLQQNTKFVLEKDIGKTKFPPELAVLPTV